MEQSSFKIGVSAMLERMSDFFEKRLVGYDAHMLTEIEGAAEFYQFTATQLPKKSEAVILDLGCGTGLELDEYYRWNPSACVTGIDLSQGMLNALADKFPGKALNLICGSYFETDLGIAQYDAAVSVESLHHFTAERKLSLYSKLRQSLKADGHFVLTDYFAESAAQENESFRTLEALKREQGITDDEFYHFDTPLTVEHEMEVLKQAGFLEVRVLRSWGQTYTILAKR